MKTFLLTVAAATALLATSARSATLYFDLIGQGGAGLLSTNEVPPVAVPSTGTGGEVGAGITFDDVSKSLTINVAWGSLNGFSDLTSTINNSHLHGPAGITAAAGVFHNLVRISSTANGGSISTSVTLTAAQEAALIAGNTYINVHTSLNGGGEIRGNLVQVPEPTHAILGLAGLALMGVRRKR